MRTLSLCLPILLLSACAGQPTAQAQAPAATPDPQACNAEAANSLVGQPATPANVEAARVKAGAASVRAYGPNAPITLDYRFDRLNVIKDADGKIVRVSCG